MTVQRQRTGRTGEDHACTHLSGLGWPIVARNARTRYGEIDIVVADREARALVFVEVKTLRAGGRIGPEGPLGAIGPRKRLQVRRLARAWLAEQPRPAGTHLEQIRFDAIGIVLGPGDRVLELEHVRSAF